MAKNKTQNEIMEKMINDINHYKDSKDELTLTDVTFLQLHLGRHLEDFGESINVT
ncbi:hypothetical protein [Aquibacillus saliphilus]|uniref:hypothetical protein n=1 Tax=Aquibacillus saliphilus TaxID=1909422 RepID=UPI001CF0C4F5|nr:hypothetical protein [Aquibacillus saliphilus]